MTDQRPDKFGIFPGSSTVGGFLIRRQDLFFGTSDFGLGEAVAACPLHFRIKSLHGNVDGLIFQRDRRHDDVAGLAEIPDREISRQEGRIGPGRNVGEPLGHDPADQIERQVGLKTGRCLVQPLATGRVFPQQRQGGRRRFRIGNHPDARLLLLRQDDAFLRNRILGGGDIRKDALQRSFHRIGIHISNNDNRLQVRTIPGMIKVDQALGSEGLQVLFTADHRAMAIFRIPVQVGLRPFENPPVGRITRTLLFQDHRAFLVDFHRVAGNEMGVIVQDEQAGIHHAGAHQGDVIEHVHGLLNSRGGIHIAAERGADALEIVQNTLSGEIFRTVEAHVLQEVGQTILIGGFLDGTYIGRQVEFGPLGRNGVVPDVIGEPVVQGPAANSRISRDLRNQGLQFFFRIILRKGGERRRHQRKKEKKSFHNPQFCIQR